MSAETVRETEGRHVLLRWATALKNYAKQLPVAILMNSFSVAPTPGSSGRQVRGSKAWIH
jgi:hypothetical protein